MYLEIDGINYLIHLKTNIDSITLRTSNKGVIELNVPALLPQEKLIYYIKNELPRIDNKRNRVLKQDLFELNIFDKNYPIKYVNEESFYIHDMVLHSHPKFVGSPSKIEKLKQNLLLNLLNDIMSMLEDELNIMLPQIILKNLKTKYSSICNNKECLAFNKVLHQKSKDFITYVVIRTVGDFLDNTEDQLNFLFNKCVSDWKHCERIYLYEQR